MEIAGFFVFLVNVSGLLTFTLVMIARYFLPQERIFLSRYATLMVFLVTAKSLQIVVYSQLSPEGVFSTDGYRYWYEIKNIAGEPWAWNPFTGQGPRYSETAKMGMSYLYGLISYAHGACSIEMVLIINVFFAVATSSLVGAITAQLCNSRNAILAATSLFAFFPETAYWTGRVVRENMAMFLVTLIALFAIRLRNGFRIGDLLILSAGTFALSLTRAQLVLFVPLIVVYYIATAIFCKINKNIIFGICGSLFLVMFFRDLFTDQIEKSTGSTFLKYFTLQPEFWIDQLEDGRDNILALLSLRARGAHGFAGMALAPFSAALIGGFAASSLFFFQIFQERKRDAGLLVFLVSIYICVLASAELINIRFRATIVPFMLALIAAAAGRLFGRDNRVSTSCSKNQEAQI